MGSETREPCPRCGKMLKPLSPRVKRREMNYAQTDAEMGIARDDSNGPAGTRRHACKPTEDKTHG